MPRLHPVRWQILEKVFLRAGYIFTHQNSSHRMYARPGSPRPVVIPAYREVPVMIIEKNLKTAGISREEFLKLLSEI